LYKSYKAFDAHSVGSFECLPSHFIQDRMFFLLHFLVLQPMWSASSCFSSNILFLLQQVGQHYYTSPAVNDQLSFQNTQIIKKNKFVTRLNLNHMEIKRNEKELKQKYVFLCFYTPSVWTHHHTFQKNGKLKV
jgi:hypothetical protein